MMSNLLHPPHRLGRTKKEVWQCLGSVCGVQFSVGITGAAWLEVLEALYIFSHFVFNVTNISEPRSNGFRDRG